MQYSTLAEVLLGIWLTISLLLPTRQVLACMLYWNFLWTRYQVPRSQPAHAKAWRQLGDMVAPVTNKVPILNKPIDMAKAWFNRTQ